jgi:hypothetical protein
LVKNLLDVTLLTNGEKNEKKSCAMCEKERTPNFARLIQNI